jgi:ribonuclease-3
VTSDVRDDDDTSADLRAELRAEASRLDRAERILAHAFRRRALLLEALTHKSYLNEHATHVPCNEQVELLGDAVLSLVTLDALLGQTPGAVEGELTDRRAAHVSEAALEARGESSGLAALLRTSKGAMDVQRSMKADLIEAVLGAVYRDAGLEAARVVAARLLGEPPRVAVVSEATNAKRTLQERLQRLFGEPPAYDAAKKDGPNHAPTFEARVMFRGAELGRGEGASKRAATEAAAEHALTTLGTDEALRARFAGDGA